MLSIRVRSVDLNGRPQKGHDVQEQPSGADDLATAVDRDRAAQLVVEAARAAVEQIAPHELEVFGEIAEQWLSRPHRRRWAAPGSAVGFGVEETLIGVIAIQAVSAAVGEVLVRGATGLRTGWLRRRVARRPALPAGDQGGDVRLTAEQARALREACHRHGIALGLPPSTADLLADAVIGRMSASPEEP